MPHLNCYIKCYVSVTGSTHRYLEFSKERNCARNWAEDGKMNKAH